MPKAMQTAWKIRAPQSTERLVYVWEKTPPTMDTIQIRPKAKKMNPKIFIRFTSYLTN